ncbi:MAG: rhomboid family intramembrane serine protease [Deltaproteobacteria bacterium]|nr:MAG: rhomboid family intramembrane serine protease [Deltaproteobacteria bacterium]
MNGNRRVRPQLILPIHRRKRTAWLTWSLIGIDVLVMVWIYARYPGRLTLDTLLEGTGIDLVPWGAQQNRYVLAGEYWRILTANFLHGGWIHLLLNAYGLYYLGTFYETLFGSWRFALVYLLSGIGAGIATLLFIGPQAASVGASGAIFGIAGALFSAMIVLQRLERGEVQPLLYKAMAIFLGINALFAFFINHSGAFAQINSAAHVGGFVTGYVLGGAFVHLSHPHGRRWRAWAWMLLLGLVAATATARKLSDPMTAVIRAEHAVMSENYGGLERFVAHLEAEAKEGRIEPEVLCRATALLFEANREAEAVARLERLAQADTTRLCAGKLLLRIFTETQWADLARAHRVAQTLGTLPHLDDEALVLLGHHALLSGDLTAALSALKRVRHKDDWTRYLIMMVYYAQGNYETIVRSGRPDFLFPLSWFLYEKALAALGRTEEVQRLQEEIFTHYTREIEHAPDDPRPKNDFAWYLAEREKNLDKADRLAREAVGLAPDVHYYHDTLAWVRYKRKAYEEALQAMEEAIERQKSAEYHFHRGVIREALGDSEGAIEDFGEALRMGLMPEERREVEGRLARLGIIPSR